jgi:hypothetical protein
VIVDVAVAEYKSGIERVDGLAEGVTEHPLVTVTGIVVAMD